MPLSSLSPPLKRTTLLSVVLFVCSACSSAPPLNCGNDLQPSKACTTTDATNAKGNDAPQAASAAQATAKTSAPAIATPLNVAAVNQAVEEDDEADETDIAAGQMMPPPEIVSGALTAPVPPAPPAPAPPVASPAAQSATASAPAATPEAATSNAPGIWERIRAGYGMPEIQSRMVTYHENWYRQRPDYIERMLQRSRLYLSHIVAQIEARGMPTELALLPFIESAFNPQAHSTARASGIWQFIPGTGRKFSLAQNAFQDERRGVTRATEAALDYLGNLHAAFGDWQLALASYNWGEGNVMRAMRKSRRFGHALTYAGLHMPKETRNYLPKLQAVKNIINDPERFGVSLPPIESEPYFRAIPITHDMDVDLIIDLAEIDADEFRALNSAFKKPLIPAAAGARILLPQANAEAFERNLEGFDGALSTWTAFPAPKTMSTQEAAQWAGMDEAELRAVNDIPPHMLIRQGSILLTPRREGMEENVAAELVTNARLNLIQDARSRRILVRAHRGDTVTTLAARYHIEPSAVALWNELNANTPLRRHKLIKLYVPSRHLKAGESVVVVVHRGETLSSIAKRYRVTPLWIAELNGITTRSLLRVGQRLLIYAPGAQARTPVASNSHNGSQARHAERKLRLASARARSSKEGVRRNAADARPFSVAAQSPS